MISRKRCKTDAMIQTASEKWYDISNSVISNDPDVTLWRYSVVQGASYAAMTTLELTWLSIHTTTRVNESWWRAVNAFTRLSDTTSVFTDRIEGREHGVYSVNTAHESTDRDTRRKHCTTMFFSTQHPVNNGRVHGCKSTQTVFTGRQHGRWTRVYGI